jgi:signal transduction histidine kinase
MTDSVIAEQPRRDGWRGVVSATLHQLLNLPLGIAFFTWAVTMLSVGAGMAITVVGLPILAFTVQSGRWIGPLERARSAAFLGQYLEPFPAPYPPKDGWQRWKAWLTDRAGWRGLGYSVLLLPWGIFTFTVAVVVWTVPLSLITQPLWAWSLPDDSFDWVDSLGVDVSNATVIAVQAIVGVALLFLIAPVIRGMAAVDRALIRSLLSPSREAALAARVEQLSASRNASVESSASELRRIERDLHDGAQQRLVGLAMDLGLARERLQQGQDPQRSLDLVTRAHEEAKGAITELRELVRGIHPSVLTDRGLDAALSAVVARSPIPVALDVSLAKRPPAAVESTAYFVVSECLTNVAKHSRATRATVRIRSNGEQLVAEIGDNGVGGVVERPGGGLAGLHDRVRAIEGTLRIASPPGGPTLIVVELPCGS